MPINHITLTMLQPKLSPLQLMQLYQEAGGAKAICDAHNSIEDIMPEVLPRTKEVLKSYDTAVALAEKEMEFCEKHSIQILTYDSDKYPQRLKECADAPLVLYYCGNAELNVERVVNVIGTRKCTPYGQDMIRSFVKDLKEMCPGTLVVSGLAYGVDIHAHRQALANGLPTVGVLAHGLDMIYPALHRETAKKMVTNGGLLSEFPSNTRPDKRNFVQRNRIVAGMSDVCVLVESASKGGGLITVGISNSYGRDVCAYPGRVGDIYSEGCNMMIKSQQAHMITCAEDLINIMGWENAAILEQARDKGIARSLFPELSEDENTVVSALKKYGDLQINLLASHTGMPIKKVSSALFTLEMKGVVRAYAGGTYHLLEV